MLCMIIGMESLKTLAGHLNKTVVIQFKTDIITVEENEPSFYSGFQKYAFVCG